MTDTTTDARVLLIREMHAREAQAEKLFAAANGTLADEDNDNDYTEDSLYEFGLGIDRKVVFTYTMSTGGPADWLEIVCDVNQDALERASEVRDLEVARVVYHYAWSGHAEYQLDEESPLWRLAEWVVGC